MRRCCGTRKAAHLWDCGYSTGPLGDFGSADVIGHVLAIQQDALSRHFDVYGGQQCGHGGLIVACDPLAKGRECHRPIHRAGIQIGEPEPGRDSLRDRPLARRRWPINGDDHVWLRGKARPRLWAGLEDCSRAHLIRSVTVSFSLITLLVDAAPDSSNW